MPEFILDTSGTVELDAPTSNGEPAAYEWSDLDAFTQGYIEALFFTENAPQVSTEEFRTETYQADMAEGMTDGSIPGDVGFGALAPEALADIIADCAAFEAKAKGLLGQAYEREYDEAQAGRDFWYTRNGHGVGFWDREELEEGALGNMLSELCGWPTEFGEVDVEFGDDGKVYHR